MKKLFLTPLLIMVFLAGCGAGEHGHSTERSPESRLDEPKEAATDDHATHQVGLLPELALDGDQKWKMDEHTRTMFSTMEARMSSVDGVDGRELGKALQEDAQTLIAGCTMQGAAHDELHQYLSTFLSALNSLAESGTPEATRLVEEHLELYPRYFE
ncbi:MAG: hypothetical protein K8J08_09000 [Thermoanaerobaculia bacterium]|nr:hypothetical protein [Thermoanaerobaculia bacterium]